ncbi:penicillin-binding protein 1C [Reinekea forsetii]|nr:penicillin-binding protein 1C [Reinekea forsetii]
MKFALKRYPKANWLGASLLAILMVFAVADWLWPVNLKPRHISQVVLAEDGRPLRAFADENGVWRYPISLSDVSSLYIEALIQYEDRYFYYHPGVNPAALMRAFGQWLWHGKIISGGSTLTMQVARLKYPEPRTLTGKLKEIFRAIQLEWHFSKDDILQYYLNHAPFGGTAEGVHAASLTYFGYGPEQLTHAQAALLAVLPQAPSRYRPDRYPEQATAARNKVLNRLVRQGVWSQSTAQDAKMETIFASTIERYQDAPILARRLANASSEPIIKTTINLAWQQTAQQRLQDYVQRIDNSASAAAMVMDSKTGAVKVYVGSADFANPNRDGYVDMVTAIRSPGSTLKPFIYGMAIDEGLVHSHSLLLDVPLRFGDYQPLNFTGGFSGAVTVADALQKSLNIPAIQVLERIGPAALYLQLQKAGAELRLPSAEPPTLSIGLGGLGTNLVSLVQLYSALGNDGKATTARFNTETEDVESDSLLSPGAAWVIRTILLTAENAPRGLAIKTGTSYGNRDSWAIGVSDHYTIGVWVGRPDGQPIAAHHGSQTAVPLLKQLASFLPLQFIAPKQPASVDNVTICWPSGQPSNGPDCDIQHSAWTVNNTTPKTWMSTKNDDQLFNDPIQFVRRAMDSQLSVPFGCDLDFIESEISLWPPQLQPWLPNAFLTSTKVPGVDPRCPNELADVARLPLRISGVNEGDALILESGSTKSINIFAQGGQSPYYWYVNGQIGDSSSDKLSLTVSGTYQYNIVLTDRNGDMARQTLNVYAQ